MMLPAIAFTVRKDIVLVSVTIGGASAVPVASLEWLECELCNKRYMAVPRRRHRCGKRRKRRPTYHVRDAPL